MDLNMDFYSIHIVSHILSSNGGFLSHGSTPWHHPVVMNEPANWFQGGPSWLKKSWPEGHLGPLIQDMGSNSGNCVKLPLLEIWKITRRNDVF